RSTSSWKTSGYRSARPVACWQKPQTKSSSSWTLDSREKNQERRGPWSRRSHCISRNPNGLTLPLRIILRSLLPKTSSHIRSLRPRSSGERRSYGRNWQSRASCPGMCASHRPDSLALPHQRPNLGPRTSLSDPPMTSGTQTTLWARL
ncbi:mCG50087, partial [Mus musculus]